MNGTTNGVHPDLQAVASPDLPNIHRALDIIFAPFSTPAERRDATVYLEQCKNHPTAVSAGLSLANDRSVSPQARYYGLSILENQIRYLWTDIGPGDVSFLRTSIVTLAQQISASDAVNVRNKIAHLWAQLAERAWGDTWLDMDEKLEVLWNTSYEHREIVLHVLETLSDEIFTKDLAASGDRGQELARAMVEVCTSVAVLEKTSSNRTAPDLRHGEQGWFLRLLEAFKTSADAANRGEERDLTSANKVLATLKSIMVWINVKAVAESNCVELMLASLDSRNVELQMGANEVLHILYHRMSFEESDITSLVAPLLSTSGLVILQRVYDNLQLAAADETLLECEEYYSLLKRFTEVICAVGVFLENWPALMLPLINVEASLTFFSVMIKHHSLVVSVPIAYLWSRLLAKEEIRELDVTSQFVGTLLEISAQRLLKYEALSPDTDDLTLRLLREDFDTMPERHAFVGNYRRYCMDIIARVILKAPREAVEYVLSHALKVFEDCRQPQKDAYSPSSAAFLRADAQGVVVYTAIKQYCAMLTLDGRDTDEYKALQDETARWCKRVRAVDRLDPLITKRLLALVIDLVIHTQSARSSDICMTLCTEILEEPTFDTTQSAACNEALKELQACYPRELLRLATNFNAPFYSVYGELKNRIDYITTLPKLDRKSALEYRSLLFNVALRGPRDDALEQAARLRSTVDELLQEWKSLSSSSIADFESFCRELGFADFAAYILERKAYENLDWADQPLDPRGFELRDRITARTDSIPLMATRSLLVASTEKLDRSTKKLAENLWKDSLNVILPKLLQLLRNSHAFSNPKSWPNYPQQMVPVLEKTLTDRVWQSGISAETREDFFNRVQRSKGTLEGLASATRAAVRHYRDLSYWILHCMTDFGRPFYTIPDLPQALADALYTDAHHLNANQMSAIIKLSSGIIAHCPEDLRRTFLPPIILQLFQKLDVKLTDDWAALEQHRINNSADESSLDAEMKKESILRQLTWSSAQMVSATLEPVARKPGHAAQLAKQSISTAISQLSTTDSTEPVHTREVVLSSPTLLEAVLSLATHILTMRDSRSVSVITRVMRELVHHFAESPRHQSSARADIDATEALTHSVREFFATDVLRTCVNSIHDPYFVDLQKDFAMVVSAILSCFKGSQTAVETLLALPGMSQQRLSHCVLEIAVSTSERQRRSMVLKLLEDVRGQSIAEQGRVERSKARPKMREEFSGMAVDEEAKIQRGGTPDLQDLGQMFE